MSASGFLCECWDLNSGLQTVGQALYPQPFPQAPGHTLKSIHAFHSCAKFCMWINFFSFQWITRSFCCRLGGFCLTSLETYLNWGHFWKPPAGFTYHSFLPDLNLRLSSVIEYFISFNLEKHFCSASKILFPWVFGLYKIQLVNSSAHHLEKNPAYISPPHRLSIWLRSSLKTHLPPLCRRCLDFQHSLNYDLFLSQCLLTLKTIF